MALSITLLCLLIQVLARSVLLAAAPNALPSLASHTATHFAVHSLPNVSFPLPPSWAGQIPIPGPSDDQLFFWLFQAESQDASQNLIIWLNGGPGCSSMTGLMYENGPLKFMAQSATPSPNLDSWTKLANVLYVDQPVGTGFSSGSKAPSNIADITNDFVHWLKAFYDHFPELKRKNTYIMGESYAGIYIPYFAQSLLSNRSFLPLNLKAIALGDPSVGNGAAMTAVVTSTYLHQQFNVLKIPGPILSAFSAPDRACGFDQVLAQLTYPPKGPIVIPGNPEGLNFLLQKRQHISGQSKIKEKSNKRQAPCPPAPPPTTPALINASIHAPCALGCATYSTALAYLSAVRPCFDPYNIRSACNAANLDDTTGASRYLNRADVKAAIHAPGWKQYEECNSTVFETQNQEDVVPPAYGLLPALLAKGVKRGLSFHRILDAGHLVPHDQPRVMYEYVREFVLGKGCHAGV
ncbi:MAG: hypothetical protein Q9173_002168 [Seirophora scorigena]